MIRLIAIAAFALAIATSAQALTRAPLQQSDSTITQVIGPACGPGYHFRMGRCVHSHHHTYSYNHTYSY
jgi:hypothetical protein